VCLSAGGLRKRGGRDGRVVTFALLSRHFQFSPAHLRGCQRAKLRVGDPTLWAQPSNLHSWWGRRGEGWGVVLHTRHHARGMRARQGMYCGGQGSRIRASFESRPRIRHTGLGTPLTSHTPFPTRYGVFWAVTNKVSRTGSSGDGPLLGAASVPSLDGTHTGPVLGLAGSRVGEAKAGVLGRREHGRLAVGRLVVERDPPFLSQLSSFERESGMIRDMTLQRRTGRVSVRCQCRCQCQCCQCDGWME
jgi:hypothetical protein